MIQQIILTIIMLLGVLFPKGFIRVTEFWRIEKKQRDPLTYTLTRVLCIVAIVLIWVMPLN